jgi:hypothetical protein
LCGLPNSRPTGQRINARLLHLECTPYHCGLSHARLTARTGPSRTAEGQPASALKIGNLRVAALLAALCLFVLTPEGITAACVLLSSFATGGAIKFRGLLCRSGTVGLPTEQRAHGLSELRDRVLLLGCEPALWGLTEHHAERFDLRAEVGWGRGLNLRGGWLIF